ncbi:hypothetical protein [Companilactobacillus kimchiensis]|uniref:Uncharacterized protein n=1 Tax=Companilactobacillus kimchiensis TaxID=993692 RepID=A0A0R2LGN4_9LACO|nr:hypothetical protein [Companilactobacillus kimchiensis]KRN97927.1 hypothetical protein IV57_GL001398 [Companilactobacillus kimchiensis]
MLMEQWQRFMRDSDYKKYQMNLDRNKPYLNTFQRNLMEKYQLHYFREHPIEDEINRQPVKLIFKITK